MKLKLSEKEIKKAINYLVEINCRFATINQYWEEGDDDSDGYESTREGLDFLIEKQAQLEKAINLILDMADTLKDNDLLDK